MQYTSELPTEPGWYWWRDDAETAAGPVSVFWWDYHGKLDAPLLVVEPFGAKVELVEDLRGEWYGPVQPPV